MVISQIIVIAIGGEYVGAAIPACLLAVYFIQKFYLRTSIRLRLLDLEAKSPLYSHFMETIEGLSTIRAFGWQESFRDVDMVLLDKSQKPFYLLPCIQLWLNFVLEMLVAGLAVLLVAIVTIVAKNPSAGYLGVALLNLLDVSDTISKLIQSWTSMETSLGAIVRVREVVEQFGQDDDDAKKKELPPTMWAFDGTLRLENVSASYTYELLILYPKSGIC